MSIFFFSCLFFFLVPLTHAQRFVHDVVRSLAVLDRMHELTLNIEKQRCYKERHKSHSKGTAVVVPTIAWRIFIFGGERATCS